MTSIKVVLANNEMMVGSFKLRKTSCQVLQLHGEGLPLAAIS